MVNISCVKDLLYFWTSILNYYLYNYGNPTYRKIDYYDTDSHTMSSIITTEKEYRDRGWMEWWNNFYIQKF